jgi:hypothetical protein
MTSQLIRCFTTRSKEVGRVLGQLQTIEDCHDEFKFRELNGRLEILRAQQQSQYQELSKRIVDMEICQQSQLKKMESMNVKLTIGLSAITVFNMWFALL